MTNIADGFEQIQEIMVQCVKKEMGNENGLLSDVETFIPLYYDEHGVEEPCIWMFQHPTTASRQADISHTMELTTPFEFDCVVYESEFEESISSSQNLTNRVILSILRNYLQVQQEITKGPRIIRNITLETYYPAGEVNIQGKSDKVPATGVILNVNHIVNWKLCCKNLGDQNNG